ncbi:MAG: HTH-type transcriptional regulator, transcriptional repressor of biosynthesis s [Chthoniobacter sp.]|jgi:NadR type nicotinamide-nucleotide adenylyltransferase|nr:HTH-type transcriptional regulator, transcriptional repressor of biosynthesis s [Chthoniobacter sp.]
MKEFGRSVCIGKFLPPHRGHKLLIDTAQERSDRVVVIVCEKPTDPIPGERRARWIQELHPAAEVMLIDDRYEADDDSELWARLTVGWLGRAPDAVFTSEDYGHAYAGAMGCVHVQVDRARERVPCSGTAIRKDPFRHWEFLEPPVRGWFARRVCILGAESTGTTTLARTLAEKFGTVWVAEYGREYSEQKLLRGESEWRSEELVAIAEEQNRREDAAAREANRVLICDTNSFATTLWHRRYVGTDCEAVATVAARGRCDLYLLTGDEIPFIQDGLRDGEHIRHEMHRWFVAALGAQQVPWLLITGSPEQRMETATAAIRRWFR